MKTMIDILRHWLERNGKDGLYQPGLCSCPSSALSPGSCLSEDCQPGVTQDVDARCEYCGDGKSGPCIGPGRTHVFDAE